MISKQMRRLIKEIKSNMDNIIWLELGVEQTRLLIGFIYIHPDTSPYANENIFSELEEEIIRLQNATGIQDFILLGDMNARTANLDEEVKFDSISNCYISGFKVIFTPYLWYLGLQVLRCTSLTILPDDMTYRIPQG